jgi:hypothetical protein
MMQAPREKTLPTMTTARQALPTMKAMMATTLLAMKVLGPGLITLLGPITVPDLITVGMRMTMTTTTAAVIKGDKQSLI